MLSRWQTELEGKAWNSLFWKNTQAPDEEGDICFRPYEAIAYAIIAGGFYMGIIYEEKSRQFHLYNDKISYIMTCLPNGQMGQLYYGKRIRHRESFGHLLEFAHRDMAPCVYENDTTFSLEHIRQEYPAFGTGDMRYPAYGIRRENGSRVSSFVYKSHIIQRGKPELPGLPAAYVEQDEEA